MTKDKEAEQCGEMASLNDNIIQAETTFEDILNVIGSFGRFQIRVFTLVTLTEAIHAVAMMYLVFGGAEPDWFCPMSPEGSYGISNLSLPDPAMFTSSVVGTMTSPAFRDGATVNVSTSPPQGQCLADGSVCPNVTFADSFTSTVSEWNLICDREYIPTLTATALMVGVLLGAVAGGQLADTVGRRKTLYILQLILCVALSVSGLSTSWQMFAAFRFVIGSCLGAVIVVSFVLPIELVGAQWRTVCGCIGSWCVGTMLLALLAYFIRDWRHLAYACGLVGLPFILTVFFVPESPRWLIQKGRFDEAEVILKDISEVNQQPISVTKLRVMMEGVARHGSAVRGEERNYHYFDLFRTPYLTKCTLLLMFIWFSCTASYYGLTINIRDFGGNRYLNVFLTGLTDQPTLISIIFLAKRFGRRPIFTGYMVLGAMFTFSVLFVKLAGKMEELPTLVVVLSLLGKSCISAAWGAAYIMSGEMFPTVVRNIGCASGSMAGRIGGIIAPQIAYLYKINTALPSIVYGSLALASAVLAILFLPETRDLPLPEIPPSAASWWKRDKKRTKNINSVDANVV